MEKTQTSHPIERCQVCDSTNLSSILFLGHVPPVNTMLDLGSVPQEETFYPLELLRCQDCTLVQVGLEVDADILFPPDYPYRSASTKILRENFADLYEESKEILDLTSSDLVMDIGSNDGTLLSNFVAGGHPVLGIEPSSAAEDANTNGVRSWMTFFGEDTAARVRSEIGPVKLATAANVFAHIGSIRAVLQALVGVLDERGVFVSESHYFPSLVETVQYDTIYHEHLRYYSLRSLMHLLELEGLEVFHVKLIPTHGGSVRVYAARPGDYAIEPSVKEMLAAEDDQGITDGSALAEFRDRVIRSKVDLHALLAPLKAQGARIHGIGAPSRASTLINYVGLDDGILDCVLEISTSAKLNKYIPGTRIPVLDEQKLFEEQPEFAFLLSWHITDELVRNLRKKGFNGRFISPLPTPRIVEG